MKIKGYFSKRKAAFRYAGMGVWRLFSREAHAAIHLVAAVCVVAAGFLFDVSRLEWCALILCIGGVFMAEGFNTAIERLADRVSRDKDPLIGAAKDIAAGAVLLFVGAAVAVGLLVFVPRFRELL